MKKKNFRDIRNAVFMLCIMLAMLSTATFAWFSMNDRVSATGMQVQAKSKGSLVINIDDPVPQNSTTTDVDFAEESATKLIPVTYDSGWKIVADPSTVDKTTGSPEAATTDVTMVKDTHYVDRLVYIASAGEEMEGQILSATVTATNTSTELSAKAITVAFYVNNDAPAANAAPDKVVRVATGETEVKTDVQITSCADAAGGIPITMRIYFDGAASNGGTAYINSAEVPTEGSVVTVEFKVAE